VNKLKLFLNKLIKLIFLTKRQKQFISHNYEIYGVNKAESSNNKIILMELNETVTSTIASSYFANHLSQNYNANIAAFFPRIPRNTFKKIVWKFRGIFGSPTYSMYKSFGVKSFIVPSLNKHLTKESDRIYNEQLQILNNKYDVENITINGIVFGDLIYDYFLNYYKIPSIDIESKNFKQHLKFCVQLIVFWSNYLKINNVEAINVTHTVYTNAIPIRIGVSLGINCFQCNESHIYRLSQGQVFAYRDFVNYKTMFENLNDDQKVSGVNEAKYRIEKRFSGEVGVDMSYSKKTAFSPPSKHRLINKSSKIKILVAPHCFFDSPHPFGFNLFPDVFEWLEELIRISNQTDYEWYVKTHPDFIKETKDIVESFFKPHLKFKILPSDASHIQLIEEGIDLALTMYGTIGFEYAAMNKPVINASLNNPHIAYDFNIHPKSRDEFTNILMNLNDLEHEINVNDVYEFYYMKNIYSNRNWLFKDFELMESHFNPNGDAVRYRQSDEDVYSYWIENFSMQRHLEILDSLTEFTNSGEYRFISN
jgi:hypothetical protein